MFAILGILVLGLVVVLGAYLAYRTLAVRREGSLLDALAQMALLPQKRRRYLLLISLEGTFLLSASIAWGLGETGAVPDLAADLVVAGFLVAGAIDLTALTHLGLKVEVLTEEERATLRQEAPDILRSLAFLPVSERPPQDEEGPL